MALWYVPPLISVARLLATAFGGLRGPAMRLYLAQGAGYTVSDRGLAVRGELGAAFVKWADCRDAVERPGWFFLRVGNQLHVLPRRDFAPGDAERFRERLREALGERASLLGS